MQELKDRIRRLLIDKLRLQDMRPEDIGDDMPLFGEGLGLDSIDALELVVAIEKEFGIKITDEEVGVKAFRSVNSLAAFIAEKTQG